MSGGGGTLTKAASVILNAAGAGQVTLGPEVDQNGQGSPGPRTWHIDTIIVQTNRPGKAPVPRTQIFKDTAVPENSQGLSYDGSFGQATGDLTLTGHETVIIQWSGGQAGDRATATLTGRTE
jgi:hypothetical protein